jgi:hypothetical protein
MGMNFQKGEFTPTHPLKYKGDKKAIYRSSYELDFCKFLDRNTKILEWAIEPFAIPYIKPTDKRIHKYYPDFWVKYIDENNNIRQMIVEIKPLSQTQAPKLTGKKKKQQIYEALTWAINQAKWKACQEFCDKYKMEFRRITQNDQFK